MFRSRIIYLAPTGDRWVSTLNWASGSGLLAVNVHNTTDTICANLDQCISSSVQYYADDEVQTVEESTNQVTAVASFSRSTHTGTATGDLLPYATQGLAQLKTDSYINGRQLRGRMFVPAPTEALNTAGFPLSTYVGVIKSAFDDVIGNTDAVLSIYSRAHSAIAPVTTCTAWNNWAEMRSRRDL